MMNDEQLEMEHLYYRSVIRLYVVEHEYRIKSGIENTELYMEY